MIVDAHNHIYYHGLDESGVIAEMDRFGVDVAWLLTWYLPPGEHVASSYRVFNPCNLRSDGTHAGATLNDISRACDRYPGRFVAGYCPCPAEGNAAEVFEAAYHMHGVRVCGEWSYRMLLDDPRSLELFRKAGELGAPVVLHIDTPYLLKSDGEVAYQQDWYGGEIDVLERALEKCPETVFIGHAPGFWRHISGDAEEEPEKYPKGEITENGTLFSLFEKYQNLNADLSAGSGLNMLQRHSDGGREFIVRFQDRLLFGRDAPGDKLQRHLDNLELPRDVMEKVYTENATRLVPVGEAKG